MSELAGGKGPDSGRHITLAAHSLFDAGEDKLCALLKEGSVVDFRGWQEEGAFETAVSSLVDNLSHAGLRTQNPFL